MGTAGTLVVASASGVRTLPIVAERCERGSDDGVPVEHREPIPAHVEHPRAVSGLVPHHPHRIGPRTTVDARLA